MEQGQKGSNRKGWLQSPQEDVGRQGNRNGGCSTWARKVGYQRKGRVQSTWDGTCQVSEAAAPPKLLECSIMNPTAGVLSPRYTLEFPGELLTLSVPKVHPNPVQSKPLGMGPLEVGGHYPQVFVPCLASLTIALHSLMYSVIDQIVIEHLLCVRHYSRH